MFRTIYPYDETWSTLSICIDIEQGIQILYLSTIAHNDYHWTFLKCFIEHGGEGGGDIFGIVRFDIYQLVISFYTGHWLLR